MSAARTAVRPLPEARTGAEITPGRRRSIRMGISQLRQRAKSLAGRRKASL